MVKDIILKIKIMERKVGEIFTYGGKTYKVVQGTKCMACDIKRSCIIKASVLGPCTSDTRSDKTHVVFKEIKDMEIKNNQLTIDIPEGMEIDIENSDLTKGLVKFKKKGITYEDVFKASNIKTISGITVCKEHKDILQALARLMLIAKYYNSDWQPNWSNSKENKYCIKFDYHKDRFYVDYNNSIGAGDVFFKNSEDVRAVINNPNFKSILNTIYKN